MPEKPVSGLSVIRGAEYKSFSATVPHLFLAGNLQLPTQHPYFRRSDVEIISCAYAAGDVGAPHWHETVDEFEIILEGRMNYTEFPSGVTQQFEKGDLVHIPKGTCVKREVFLPSRTVALKLPSDASKVCCAECDRECGFRIVT